MTVNFLTGSLTLRKHRTGVHLYHENLLKELMKDPYYQKNITVSCYATEKDLHKEFPQYKEEPYANNIRFSHKMVRILSYFLPIEFFFGSSDVYFCDGLIPITLHKKKKIAVIFDLMVKIYPQNYSLIRKIYLNFYFRRCKKADYILTISQTTKNDIIQYLNIPQERIYVGYIGYETAAQENAIIKDSKISNLMLQVRYAFYIGDMRKNKNLINAVKSVEYANNQGIELYFYIAGAKSDEYSSLHDYVEKHSLNNRIQFLGYITEEEKARLYKNAFALLFISDYEGFGIPILEAAGYGIPVITSNRSSMKEIAENYSILVDPHDVKEIAKSFELIMDNRVREKSLRSKKNC